MTCSTCGKTIKGTGILSPTLDPKKQNRCVGCAAKDVNEKAQKLYVGGGDVNKLKHENRISGSSLNTRNKADGTPPGPKVVAPSSPAQEDWEKKFNRMFKANWPISSWCLDDDGYDHSEEIEDFIRETLASERQRLVGEGNESSS